jgi:hypothetical protein
MDTLTEAAMIMAMHMRLWKRRATDTRMPRCQPFRAHPYTIRMVTRMIMNTRTTLILIIIAIVTAKRTIRTITTTSTLTLPSTNIVTVLPSMVTPTHIRRRMTEMKITHMIMHIRMFIKRSLVTAIHMTEITHIRTAAIMVTRTTTIMGIHMRAITDIRTTVSMVIRTATEVWRCQQRANRVDRPIPNAFLALPCAFLHQTTTL